MFAASIEIVANFQTRARNSTRTKPLEPASDHAHQHRWPQFKLESWALSEH